MTDAQFLDRIATRERLGIIAVVGVVVLAVALFALPDGTAQATTAFLGGLAVLPAFVYLFLLTSWHWKGRYRGSHSDLWGGLLLLETSGWFKVVYLFRHIVPDARGTGRYRREPRERAA